MNHFSFFQKEAMVQFLGQLSTRVAAAARVGTRTSTEREEFGEVYVAHCFAACEEMCCVVIGDRNYPYRVAFDMAALAIEQFLRRYKPIDITGDARDNPFPELQVLLDRYQKPEQADTLLKMRRDLVDTQNQLHGNMNMLLDRGDKVENLVRKSDTLKSAGTMFKRVVKKRAPTPPRGISDKIKVSFALSALALVLVGISVATNELLTAKVYPQEEVVTPVDSIAVTYGMIRTCYIFTLADTGEDTQYCAMSRALGGSDGCPKAAASSGTVPSFLGLIVCGMFFLSHSIALGFSVCISRRPDQARQFAIIALVLGILSSVSLGVCCYTWANAFSNPYFVTPADWCVLEGELEPILHNVSETCVSELSACRTEVNWGYSSFILWISLGCAVGVLGCQIGETATVLTSDPGSPEDQFLSKQYESAEDRRNIFSNEDTPLLINDGENPADFPDPGTDYSAGARTFVPGSVPASTAVGTDADTNIL